MFVKIVKLDYKPVTIKTYPANVLALLALDLRNLANEIPNYRCKVAESIDIFKYSKKIGKDHLWNSANFGRDLYEQCRQILRYSSSKPAYYSFNNERIDLEKMMILKKFDMPVHIENEREYYRLQLEKEFKKVEGEIYGKIKPNFI